MIDNHKVKWTHSLACYPFKLHGIVQRDENICLQFKGFDIMLREDQRIKGQLQHFDGDLVGIPLVTTPRTELDILSIRLPKELVYELAVRFNHEAVRLRQLEENRSIVRDRNK